VSGDSAQGQLAEEDVLLEAQVPHRLDEALGAHQHRPEVPDRYRLIWTNLSRYPDPVDWTHEREWRIRGDLKLNPVSGVGVWWWPCVERDADCAEVFAAFNGYVSFIYSMETARVIPRS